MSFYNTTSETGATLELFTNENKRQSKVIREIFRKSAKPLTPSDVRKLAQKKGCYFLIGSVRRAMSDLTIEGVLTKLEAKKMGAYNHPECFWVEAVNLVND